MALVVNDRVKETSTTTGTGTLTLAGAVTGFETFSSAIGNTNTTYYSIVNENGEFEVGLGTVSAGALARTTVISSSNSDSAVNFSAGTKDVFCTLPASKAVIKDASGNIVANNGSNLTALNATQLTSGTVPDARFPSTLPALNGSALTNLNATALASGTVANARLDAQLQDVAGLATTSGKIIQGDGSNFGLSAYTLPTSDGSSAQVLTTNGSGAVTFQTPTVGDITAVTAGTNLTGGGSSGDVTLNLADASTSAKGAASFSSDNFAASSGAITIKDLGVATAEIQNDAVTQAKIADDAVGADQLAADAVVTASIVDANVTTAKVADNAITLAKMASGTDGNIISYDASGDPVAVATGNAGQVLTSAGAGAPPTFQTPTVGDITAVTAGTGLTGGGTSGDVTLNVGAGTGVTVNADDIAIGQDVATSASPTFAGLTTTADINFGDNDKAVFGAGNDLQIYHDGSQSIIEDAGTGQLKILAENTLYLGSATGSERYISAVKNGAVDLSYNNSVKLETTSAGVQTTGTVNVNGAYTLPTSDGSANQVLTTDGSGAVTFATPTTGDITGVTAGTLLDGGGTSGDVTLNVDLSELTTSTSNGDGDFFVVVDSANAQKKLTKGNINNSGFNNDAGYTTNVGDITSVVAGSGLTGGATSGAATLNIGAGNLIDVQADQVDVDLSELSTSTTNGDGDFFVVVDSSNNQKKLTKGNINNSGFNNDAGYTTNVGDITGVTAGTNLTGGGTSGSVTINLADASTSAKGAASFSSDNFAASSGAITIKDSGVATAEIQDNAVTLAKMAGGTDGNIISYDTSGNPVAVATGSSGQVLTSAGAGAVPSFQTIAAAAITSTANGANNRIATYSDADSLNGEANLTFDGSTLTVTGAAAVAGHITPGANDTYDLGSTSAVWRNIYTGDLHLSNEAKDEGNAIDGTKGNWTIQEGENDLYILNNKSGKKYKFKLEEM